MCVFGLSLSALPVEAFAPASFRGDVFDGGITAEASSGLEEAEAGLRQLYEGIAFGDAARPGFELFTKAMLGFVRLKQEGSLQNENILSLIDFSISSSKKRLWIIDLKARKLLFHELVAHGKNSGGDLPDRFSNTVNSNQSSLGFYVTRQTYYGKHGLSLRLQGMEKGFNDNAMRRAVVMHGADYVNEGIIGSLGRLGRSFGCPSVSKAVYKPIINLIKDGSCLFIYYPDKTYLSQSAYLADEQLALQQFLKFGIGA